MAYAILDKFTKTAQDDCAYFLQINTPHTLVTQFHDEIRTQYNLRYPAVSTCKLSTYVFNEK